MPRTTKRARKGDPRRAVGYIRVSTEDQKLGPEAQRAALESWCASHELELVAVHIDNGVSGGAPVEDRPALIAGLADVEAHGAGVLLVAKRDRLARSVINASLIERLALDAGARVVSTEGIGNDDSAEDALMRTLLDAFAQFERAKIRLRTIEALRAKKRRGERAGHVPFGWCTAADGQRLVADAREQAALERMRTLKAAGATLDAITAQLEREGFRGRDGQRISRSAVGRFLLRDARAEVAA